MKKKKDACEHRVKIDAFGGKYTLCLYLRNFKEEPIVKNSYDALNISIFNNLNVSNDVSIEKATATVWDEFEFSSVHDFSDKKYKVTNHNIIFD